MGAASETVRSQRISVDAAVTRSGVRVRWARGVRLVEFLVRCAKKASSLMGPALGTALSLVISCPSMSGPTAGHGLRRVPGR